ncbi:hypothetical protein [Epilithonimonas mollis]|uniref:Uncharacterized protein n=1 Tax=Epilithonimonas mollis TaxID=216903 RepID=A0A1M6UQI8_9FLAO|nr:hypothetical protein [Epilithonimonas mollis]SHK71406.1 hypothetical protein SAMN05444371_3416 [Epilithonimonas mollis]
METIKITGKNGTLKELIHDITFSKIITKFNMRVRVFLSGVTIITIEEKLKNKPTEFDMKELDNILRVHKKKLKFE